MTVELSMNQQSMLMDIEMFIGDNWSQFQGYCEANGLTVPQDVEIEALFETVTGNKS